MKLTKSTLKQIIKEELEKVLSEQGPVPKQPSREYERTEEALELCWRVALCPEKDMKLWRDRRKGKVSSCPAGALSKYQFVTYDPKKMGGRHADPNQVLSIAEKKNPGFKAMWPRRGFGVVPCTEKDRKSIRTRPSLAITP